jgi:hypothetical protein
MAQQRQFGDMAMRTKFSFSFEDGRLSGSGAAA